MEFQMPSCGGCRTCEIACSFHHRGEFIPSISSLKILDNRDNSGYSVLIVEEKNAESLACDGCKEEEIPLCVEYCREGEDLKKLIHEFLERRGSEKKESEEGTHFSKIRV